MNFDLTDDQIALRDGARDLLDRLANPMAVRRFSESSAPYDDALWTAMLDQGWLGVAVAEADGGLGLGVVELAVVLEEIGRHVAPAPVLPTVLAIDTLLASGRRDAASALLSGEATACISWSRRANAVTARPDGEAWLLDGRADPTPYASCASLALVFATEPDGVGVFAVDLDAVGRPPREPAMDLTRPLAWLNFDATPAERIGGTHSATRLFDHSVALTAAEMLGAAGATLDTTVAYAKEREQFGKPIGSFQAIKHRCADMLVDVEGMRSTAYWAAWSIGADAADASIAASTAKIWGSDAAKRVMASALQVHGGIGFTWEHDLHFFMKRSQLDQLLFGDAAYHRNHLVAHLRPRVEDGHSVL